jgi:hypothetical protein
VGSKVVNIAVSDAMRDIEARREEGEDVKVTAEVLDDGAIFLDTTSVPWRVPRPPDAPPPAITTRAGGRMPEPETLERRAYVEQLWRSSYAPSEILTIVTSRWNVSRSTVKEDISRVRKKYLSAVEDPAELLARKEQMRATLLDLAREARAAGDRSTARYVYDKIIRLDGNYVTKVDVSVAGHVTASVDLQIEMIVQHLDGEGLRALEVVLAQLEAAGIVKAPELANRSPSDPQLGPGSVIDVDSVEVDGDQDGDEDDDEDD